MTTIIAFAGRKQSGKTTCSQNIIDLWNSKIRTNKKDVAKIYNFADPLKKDICMNILGMTYDHCYGSDEQKNAKTNIEWNGVKLTAREVMQFIGTDIFRKMKQDVWANAIISKIKIEQPSLAVIADCRFPNEVQVIKDIGGYVIKLNRNPFNSDHESERALDDINYDQSNFDLVLNNQSMNLEQQSMAIYNFIRSKGIIQL